MTTQAIETRDHPAAFREWFSWADCTLSQCLDRPGVYILAVFAGDAPHSVDVESDRICYIGSASERTLAWELQQFKYRCPAGIEAGGCEHLKTDPTADNGCHLWVAVFPICDLDEPLRSAFIRHVERELIWKWVSKNGRLPDCNAK